MYAFTSFLHPIEKDHSLIRMNLQLPIDSMTTSINVTVAITNKTLLMCQLFYYY